MKSLQGSLCSHFFEMTFRISYAALRWLDPAYKVFAAGIGEIKANYSELDFLCESWRLNSPAQASIGIFLFANFQFKTIRGVWFQFGNFRMREGSQLFF